MTTADRDTARTAAVDAPRTASAGPTPAHRGRSSLRDRARGVGFREGSSLLSPRGSSARNSASSSTPGAATSTAPSAPESAVPASRPVGRILSSARQAAGRLSRQVFVRSGPKGPEDVRPPTGIGGFQVCYDPATMLEHIRIAGAVAFRNGIDIVDGKAVATHEGIEESAREIRRQAGGNLALLVQLASRWQWTEGEKAAWLARLEAVVEAGWDRQFLFHAQPEGWEDLEALTSVDVQVRNGEKTPADHLALEVYKTPSDLAPVRSMLVPGTAGPMDNRMILGSTDVGGSLEDFGYQALEFPEGSVDLDPTVLPLLKSWAIRFRSASALPARVTVHVQGEGDRLFETARQRYDSLSTLLDLQGFDTARLRFAYAGPGRQAVLQVGDGAPQVIARHEFGHAFGLKDEYADDPGGGIHGRQRRSGTPGGHDALARSVGLQGSVVENSDSLMSLGNALRPSYGAPFLWALRKVTRMDGWGDTPPARSAPLREEQA